MNGRTILVKLSPEATEWLSEFAAANGSTVETVAARMLNGVIAPLHAATNTDGDGEVDEGETVTRKG